MQVKEFIRAKSLDEAYALLSSERSVIVAGGFWLKKMNQDYDRMIDLSLLNLGKIEELKDYIKVGSMATQRDYENSPLIQSLFSDMSGFAVREIMSVPFRNSATIGGSIMGKYPFSDLITSLLCMDVTLEFYPQKEISLMDFLNSKEKNTSILTSILIKKENGKGYFKKVKTTALDFPLVNIAVSRVNKTYKIAIGSRPMVASLCFKAMEYLNSLPNIPNEKEIEEASLIAASELKFLNSYNISGEYRLALAKTYIRRGLEEVNK